MKKEVIKVNLPKAMFLLFVIIFFFMVFFKSTQALSGPITSSGKNLTIWDDTDEQVNTPDRAFYNLTFYANYTNSTAHVVNNTCQIQFQNYTGSMTSWINMTYDSITKPQNYTTFFNYKGNFTYNINCSNATFSMNLSEYYNTLNTIPSARFENGAQFLDIDGNGINHDIWSCVEDTLCYFNFSASNNNTLYTKVLTELDVNDNLTHSVGSNTTINSSIYSLNSSTGVLRINATNSYHNGTNLQIQLNMRDTETTEIPSLLAINVTPVNDAPVFANLANFTVNATAPGNNFTAIIYALDEESSLPFRFNITFSHCAPANWSTRNGNPNNCTIWNSSSYNINYNSSAVFVNFTPYGRDDVGSYFINFSVTDNGSAFGFPNNAQSNMTINFTVLNVNLAPNLTYFCNREFNATTPEFSATEDSFFSCYVNASDLDETLNLTFSSNETWFLNSSNGTFSNYNGSAPINFTPIDTVVGNWTINLSVRDNDIWLPPNKYSSRVIRIVVANVNDSVGIFAISNFTGFTGNSYTIQANATDNDLLIPDKNNSRGGYNESINFTARNSSGGVIPWITISKLSDSSNLSRAVLSFSGNSTTSGNTTINLSVVDNNGFSQASVIFNIQIVGNNAPEWNASFPRNFTLTEGTSFFQNLSGNVSDIDGDRINFTYSNYSQTAFPTFFANANITGLIGFTPRDADVGSNNVTINATDGRTPASINVNFTVNNVNDAPDFESISPVTVSEDSEATFQVSIIDEDFLIRQKAFYNENITFNFTIDGPNTNLLVNGSNFNLSLVPANNPSRPNQTLYTATFTPNKSDLGGSSQRVYTIYLQATDESGSADLTSFTITINSVNHNPVLSAIGNQSSYLNGTLVIRPNVTDLDQNSTDLNGTFNFTYQFLSGTSFLNSTTFNNTRGIVNITFNSSQVGAYHVNLTVYDSENLRDSEDFWVNVYSTPYFISYSPTSVYSVENSTITINISANHSIGDNLNYSILLNGVLRNSTMGVGTGLSTINLSITFNFTEETSCTGIKNLTINVSNAYFSNSTIINATINHTNAPVQFDSVITNTTAGRSVEYTLTNYFSDLDILSDSCNNASVNFSYVKMNSSFTQISTGIFSVSVSNWTNTSTPTFNVSASSTAGAEYYQIIANDTYTLTKSNNFSVNLTPSVTTITTPSSGGGGGSVKPVSLKIIFPDQVSAFKFDEIVVPLTIMNSGQLALSGIDLSSLVATNGSISDDIQMSFTNSHFDSLNVGDRKYTNLTISINTKATGRFEITVNASVRTPQFNDWGKFFLNIIETNKTEVEQIILFTNELIVQNPECAELQESLNRARKALEEGKTDDAWQSANEIVRACRNAIAQRPSITKVNGPGRNTIVYIIFGVVGILFLVFVYHLFNRIKMQRYDAANTI